MSSLRDALEAALVEDLDDLATHRAYADYLQEQGDPRGEFIQVQLALEDPGKTAEERQQLQTRERELLTAHGRDWLGVLAGELLGPIDEPWESREDNERPYDIRFARGWLDRIVRCWTPIYRGGALGELLCKAPESRLLRELILEYDDHVLDRLVHSPFLTNLRRFRLGGKGDEMYQLHQGWEVADFVSRLSAIEELYLLVADYEPERLPALPNLNHLRVLQLYHLAAPYPLEVLAENSALGSLTHLLLHPHRSDTPLIDLAGVRAVIRSPGLRSLSHLQVRCSDLGDVGCTEIVTSGILKRLKMLDLRHGAITDAGARILADCSDLRRLEHLDIGCNGLTQTGIDALHRVLGPAVRADNQQTPAELAQEHYLQDGIFE